MNDSDPGWDPRYDLANNGKIDMATLSLFAADWLYDSMLNILF